MNENGGRDLSFPSSASHVFKKWQKVNVLKSLDSGAKAVFSIPMTDNHRAKRADLPVVFVVDDEVMLLDLAEMVLEPGEFMVRTFADPRQALADYKSATRRPDLVVTDYAMEGMNGLELIQECRKIHPGQKTLLVSGTVDESVYANSAIKPERFLAKPYNPDEFVAAVRALSRG
jgi:CheY-like chemotaxis protein